MIKKLVGRMLTAQIISALTVSLCLLIDSVIIGQYLGVRALAAYGLANPVLLVIGGIGTVLSSGIQVVCSREIGRGEKSTLSTDFSSGVGFSLAISLLFLLLVFLLKDVLPHFLGAGNDEALFQDTKSYLLGFSVGAPGCMCSLILVPFLQFAGKSSLLIVAVLGMTAADIVFDLLNVIVFHGGMFGMGMASALSYYVAMLIGYSYFFSKKSIFRFSFKKIKPDTVKSFFKSGMPTVFTMVSGVLLSFSMNRFMLSIGGGLAVAAYAVVISLANSCNCTATGMNGVALTLSGMLYQEKDKNGLEDLVGSLAKRGVLIGTVEGLAIAAAAPFIVSIFIKDNPQTYSMAVHGLRLFALAFVPCCLSNMFKGLYLGMEKTALTEVFSVLEGFVFQFCAALCLGLALGTNGVWLYFAAGEVMSLLFVCIHSWHKMGKISLSRFTFLLLDSSFGIGDDDSLEFDIHTVEQAVEASEKASEFCIQRTGLEKLAMHVALCIEEMAVNVIEHGLPGKKNTLSVCVQDNGDRIILRMRDDCRAFNPLSYIYRKPREKEATGIMLMMKFSDEVRYSYSMNMNSVFIAINKAH